MNQIEIGKLIAKARKEKGYTQQELANFLFVTDKAVSKWERGLSLPDSNTSLKMSTILDMDVEQLIPRNNFEGWVGSIILNETNFIYKENVGGQTVFEHLVSIFALLKIKKIYVKCSDNSFIKKLNLEKYGIEIFYNVSAPIYKVVEIEDNFILYGANLTRWLESLTSLDSTINIQFSDSFIPLKIKNGFKITNKKLGRGYIYLLLSKENIKQADNLVSSINSALNINLNSLSDITKIRNK